MVKPAIIAGGLLMAPAVVLSGCANGDQSANETTTTSSPETTASLAPGTERLTTQLRSADGTPVANATIDFANGYATVTVETVATGILSPGFHGLHLHSVGKCEANSVAPTGGASGDFNSAGGHFQAPGHTGSPASGDLTSLEVRSDGAAKLVTTTDSFTAADLLAGEKTALMIHEKPDNFGNIPADRYQQKNGAAGPDQETLSTGDSGRRVACGVIGSASSTTTSSTTTTTTTTAATETETTVIISPTTTVAPPPTITETTGTTTVTAPTTTSVTTSPGPPTTTPPPGG
jgi:superoxide dismutase, Cu-Zn family